MRLQFPGTRLGRRIKRFFTGAEDGAALTEFVMTLPVFLIIMAGLITLGRLGEASVAVKTHAYKAMWGDTIVRTTDDWKAMTPRSKLDNPLKQVIGQVIGSAVDNFTDGLPGEIKINIPGATNVDGADGAVGLGGHWGEAEYYGSFGATVTQGEIDHRAHNHRLAQIDSAAGASTTQILGPSGSSKPRLALDDNLMSNTAFEGFELSNLWAGPTSLKDLFDNAKSTAAGGVSDVFYDLISGSGFIPGVMAGIRYGRGIGVASTDVKINNGLFDYSANYQGVYMTAPSPYTGGKLNSEKLHWLFYVGGTQLNHNQRHMLNLVKANLETDDLENPEPYWH